MYDPFVGTGSLMVAASAVVRDAVVVGSDIDDRVLRGKQGRTIASNFKQYGLNVGGPELMLMDSSKRYVCIEYGLPTSLSAHVVEAVRDVGCISIVVCRLSSSVVYRRL